MCNARTSSEGVYDVFQRAIIHTQLYKICKTLFLEFSILLLELKISLLISQIFGNMCSCINLLSQTASFLIWLSVIDERELFFVKLFWNRPGWLSQLMTCCFVSNVLKISWRKIRDLTCLGCAYPCQHLIFHSYLTTAINSVDTRGIKIHPVDTQTEIQLIVNSAL